MMPPQYDVSLSKRRAVLPVRRLYWIGQLYEARWGLVVLIGTLVLAVWFAWFKFSHILTAQTDVAGMPLHSGEAVVISKTFQEHEEKPSTLVLVFRIQNHVVTKMVTDTVKWGRTNRGDTVPVTYQIGKSSNFDITDWQPPRVRLPLPLNR
jgi:hypothetical protein